MAIVLIWQSHSAKAEERVYDVIPISWITHNGKLQDDLPSSQSALIFPSLESGNLVDPGGKPFYTAADLLGKCNDIEVKRKTYRLTERKGEEKLYIQVAREQKGSRALNFYTNKDTLTFIRRLSWTQFLALQNRFEKWLRAEGRGLLGALLPDGSVFNHGPCLQPSGPSENCYENSLKKFWRKVLAGAEFSAFRKMHLKPLLSFPPDANRPRPNPDDDAGPSFGAVPLLPGMRLAIHWGGTANYNYQSDYVTRQTTAGTSHVEVVRAGDGVKLKSMALGVPPHTQPSRLNTMPPAGEDEKENILYLPFGTGQDHDEYRMVPVQAEIDRFNADLLAAVNANDEALGKHLTLLIPSEYTKSDSFKKSKSGDPNRVESSDALNPAEGGAGSGDWKTALRRRFMIFRSKVPFSDPAQNAPFIPQTNATMNWSRWTFLPAVFGNQTTLEIEVPVLLGPVQIEWQLFGTTWGELIGGRLAPSLAQPIKASCQAYLTVRRTKCAHDDPVKNLSRVFRFYTYPINDLKVITVEPNDNFSTSQ